MAKKNITIIFALLLILSACTNKTYQTVYPTLSDGRYDSEFPYRSCSQELDFVSKTVKKLYCLVEYDQYFFNESDKIRKQFIVDGRFKSVAYQKSYFSESVHGTGTIIYNDGNRVAILSCAHVVDYPDTIFALYYDGLGNKTDIIENIAIKRKQLNFVRDLPGDGLLEIIAIDKEKDVVFLGNRFKDLGPEIQVFNYPAGKAQDLEWGSFVYIMGFPGGHQMVTRGIVSNPHPGKGGEFLIDALFNPGVSGGIVLAVKDGVPNFELVGIAKSVSAKYKNVIKPGKESHEEIYNPNVPYEGELFVKIEKDINYGVTFTIAIEEIAHIYLNNRNNLITSGYNLDKFFGIE